MLSNYGVAVPHGELAYTPEQAKQIAEKLGMLCFSVSKHMYSICMVQIECCRTLWDECSHPALLLILYLLHICWVGSVASNLVTISSVRQRREDMTSCRIDN